MKSIILSGGSGTRLWPLSREFFPKQYLKFPQLGNKSLFQLTFERAMKISGADNILIITNEKQKFLVMGEIEELDITFPENNIILEPERRDTFPAITYAMQHVKDRAIVMPSDHLIGDDEPLINAVEMAKNYPEAIVTFGIRPTFPHTGYGYIHHDHGRVLEFKEKPDQATAKEYVKKGYLWNAGLFFMTRKTFENELWKAHPDVHKTFTKEDIHDSFSALPKTSFDYAILERSDCIMTIPLDIDWNDLGSFDAIFDAFEKDNNGNVRTDQVITRQAHGNYVSTYDAKTIVLNAVDNLIVVDTDDALLVTGRYHSEHVKDIVKEVDEEKACFHTTVYRPWGSFRCLEKGRGYQVKRLTVLPGKALTLQKHAHRSEHWVVIDGTATVTKGEDVMDLQKDESVNIPKGTKHRLENRTTDAISIIETQSGEYLGEDDIVRYDDAYGRVKEN